MRPRRRQLERHDTIGNDLIGAGVFLVVVPAAGGGGRAGVSEPLLGVDYLLVVVVLFLVVIGIAREDGQGASSSSSSRRRRLESATGPPGAGSMVEPADGNQYAVARLFWSVTAIIAASVVGS
jgi:hypothetical protein